MTATTTPGLFDEAERLRDQGDVVGAIDIYRQVVARDESHVKARSRLSGLLERRATEILDLDLDEALALYRQAWNLDRGREKLHRRYLRALRRKFAAAMLERDNESARETLRQVRELGEATPVDELRASAEGLESLSTQLPLVDLAELLDEWADSRWLVLVDTAVDLAVLPAMLRGLPDADLFSRRSLPEDDEGNLGTIVTPLIRAGTYSYEGEERTFARTDPLASRMLACLAAEMPRPPGGAAGLDVLDLMSFEVDDTFFRAANDTDQLEHLIRSGDYGLVLCVTGDGTLVDVVQALGEVTAFDLPVFELRCTRFGDYDSRPRRLAPSDRGPTAHTRAPGTDVTFHSEYSEPHSDPHSERDDAPGRSLGGRGRRVASRARQWVSRRVRGRRHSCALVAAPNPRHVSNVASIARRLDAGVEVVAAPLFGDPKLRITHRAFETLAAEHPGAAVSMRCATPAGSWASGAEDWVRRASASLEADARSAGDADDIPVIRAAEPALQRLIGERFEMMSDLARRVDLFLETMRPDVMLVSPDRASEVRVVCELARRHRIPTVFPQLVFFSESPRYKPLQADYICVLDEHHRELFVGHFGARPEQVLVTGIPRFDVILDRRERGLRPPPDDRTVLLVLQALGSQYNDTLVDLAADAVLAVGGRLVVKVHPRDTAASVRHLERRVDELLGDRGEVHWETDVHDLAEASDVVVSTFSNVVFEAAMLDRPVICANLTSAPLPVPFVEQGLAFGVETADALKNAIEDLVQSGEHRSEVRARRDAYFERNPHLLVGRASDRVARIVETLARHGRPPEPT